MHLYNTRWAIVLPYIISAYNLIITRSFFESLPEEMAEAVKIDGGSEWTVMTRIFIPLSKPIISVLILFYGVGYWNSCLLYTSDIWILRIWEGTALILHHNAFMREAE